MNAQNAGVGGAVGHAAGRLADGAPVVQPKIVGQVQRLNSIALELEVTASHLDAHFARLVAPKPVNEAVAPQPNIGQDAPIDVKLDRLEHDLNHVLARLRDLGGRFGDAV